MFTETKSRLGWRTGASRFAMKEQLELLQSFDPAERAQAGQQLVELGLTRCAEPLLDHVANEFDNRVLAAVAGAVVQAPPESKESRKAKELREWAAAELERSALEEAFMGSEPGAVAFPPEPDFQFPLEPDFPTTGLEPEREPLPVRVPVAAVAIEPTDESAAEPAPNEYRFEVPEPEAEPIEYRPAEVEDDPTEPPVEPAPEEVEYRFEGPAPVAGYPVEAYEPETYEPEAYEPEAYEPEAPPYISWRPPADDDSSGGPSTNGGAAGNGNGHDPVTGTESAPALEAELVEVDPDPEPETEIEAIEDGVETPEDESPAPTAESPADEPADSGHEFRFEAPDPAGEPAGDGEVSRFEGPLPSERHTEPEPTTGEPRTLAERLRARDA